VLVAGPRLDADDAVDLAAAAEDQDRGDRADPVVRRSPVEEPTMSLSKDEVHDLMGLVNLTKAEEIDCDACLVRVAEFAERELASRSVQDGLQPSRIICPSARNAARTTRRSWRRSRTWKPEARQPLRTPGRAA
jgi:hypothetical protein